MTMQPLGFSQLFDAILNAVIRNFWTFARLVLLVAVPARVVEVVILTATVSNANDITSRSVFSARTGAPTNGAVGVNLTVALLGALIVVIGTALCFKAASAAYAGTRTGWRPSAEFARPRVAAVLWVAIIGAIGVTLGLIALIVPGVWLAISWSVAIPVLLFEGLGPTRALGRSFQLVRGRWWATLGILAVAWLISNIASGLVQSAFDALMSTSLGDHVFPAAVIDALGGTVAAAIALPLEAVAVTMLYYDLRARREVLGVDVIARRLDLQAASAPAPDTEPSAWAPPTPPGNTAPPSDWAPPQPPGVEGPEA